MAEPLKPEAFSILLALLDGPRHGYAILQATAEEPGPRGDLQPGSLYRLLARLLDAGLVTELGEAEIPDGADSRRRYYRVTDAGRQAVVVESERMAALVDAARERLADTGGEV